MTAPDGCPPRCAPRCLPRLLLAVCLALAAGCSSSRWVEVRSVPRNPLVDRLKLTSWWGPEPSERTALVARRYGVEDDVADDPGRVLEQLQAVIQREPTPEAVYAFAEVAFLAGKARESGDPRAALDFYGASATHAYMYLFDKRFAGIRNPYDPQYRGACDLYNGALEAALRIMLAAGPLTPGGTYKIQSARQEWDLTVVRRSGRWTEADFDELKFASDYEVTGIANHYRTHGLGVPLIAVRKPRPDEGGYEAYFPRGLSFPVTAFIRLMPGSTVLPTSSRARRQALLELYDPTSSTEIEVAGIRVPLEADLTTPLAYFLNESSLESFATFGLFRPDEWDQVNGLIMTQPFDPQKIPVVFVHGLWSDPSAWAAMFNDLRATPQIRDRYQFWFYMYPTGEPFWISAAQMRADLREMRKQLDPQRRSAALDQMVLVGHSMGGLVSKLQVVSSGNDYWNAISPTPFQQVKASEQTKARLAGIFFFEPSASIRRVITIAAPHRGSSYANRYTQWLSSKLINLPQAIVEGTGELLRENPDAFRSSALTRVRTSIDSLAPDSPLLPVLLHGHRPPSVRLHNIIGREDADAEGDGVVSLASAHLDDADSEIVVETDHVTIHQHPLTTLEVRRILLEHLRGLPWIRPGYPRQRPQMRTVTGPVLVR